MSSLNDALPVKLEDVNAYVKRYEAEHSLGQGKGGIPSDPSSGGWFGMSRKQDPFTDCVERCKYELYKTALSESGLTTESYNKNIPLNEAQRIVQSRYALLQSECSEACFLNYQDK